MIDMENSNIQDQILIGRGGYASVYKVTRNNREEAMKQIDVKLYDMESAKKMANFFKKLFRELLVIQKIKKSSSTKLLKYHGFSARINRYHCLEVNLFSDLMKQDL